MMPTHREMIVRYVLKRNDRSCPLAMREAARHMVKAGQLDAVP